MLYRVRVKQSGRPRSRILSVQASTDEEAQQRALANVGAGWELLDLERRD